MGSALARCVAEDPSPWKGRSCAYSWDQSTLRDLQMLNHLSGHFLTKSPLSAFENGWGSACKRGFFRHRVGLFP
jgi:hypothetical protein